MAILRFFKDSNVLENNMVQTQASAAGTLSAVIFVLPGLLMIGYWQNFDLMQTLLLSACGGCLGVLFTIPLRRAMVMNSDLPYPEGRAAAEILKVGSSVPGETTKQSGGMKEIVSGGVLAGVISFVTQGLRVLGESKSFWFPVGAGATQIPFGFSSALLGAGFLIGIASGIAILIGMIIAWGGFVPYLTNHLPNPDNLEAIKFSSTVWKTKVRFIGAGTIGVAAIWTLLTLIKPIIEGIKLSIKSMTASAEYRDTHRMDTDMKPSTIGVVFALIIIGLIICFYSFVSALPMSAGLAWTLVIAGIVVALLIGFFVAAACGYMAGLIGTSASPISGIGIIGIIIAAISNDNLQDLKTGQLVGATPWKQQVALLIGSLAGAVAIAPVLDLLYHAYGFTGAMPREGMDPAQALSAPQATLMRQIAEGIFNANMDWTYIFYGIVVGIVAIVVNLILKSTTKSLTLPPLAIGMGIYLPPTLEMPLVMGAIIGYFVNRYITKRAKERAGAYADADVEQSNRRGVLFASGLIVGESIIGVIIAGVIAFSVSTGGSEAPLQLAFTEAKSYGDTAEWLGFASYIFVALCLIRIVIASKFNKAEAEAIENMNK